MPIVDDATIPPDAILLRVLVDPNWVTNKGGTRRPASIAFVDANSEASFFIADAGMIDELRRIFGSAEVARVPAAAIRTVGFGIERRPAECPSGFLCDPASHVVVGPRQQMQRNTYEKTARLIAKEPGVALIPRP